MRSALSWNSASSPRTINLAVAPTGSFLVEFGNSDDEIGAELERDCPEPVRAGDDPPVNGDPEAPGFLRSWVLAVDDTCGSGAAG